MNLLKLAPLLSKTPDQLTDADLATLADNFAPGVVITPELKVAAMALLKGQDINKVSDLIQSPEAIKQLVELVRGPAVVVSEERVVRCKHCLRFSIV